MSGLRMSGSAGCAVAEAPAPHGGSLTGLQGGLPRRRLAEAGREHIAQDDLGDIRRLHAPP